MCAAARPPSTRPSIRCGVAFPMCSISTPTAKAQKLKVSLADCGFHAHEHGCQMAIARFLESYVFGPSVSGLWLRYATLQNLIPSFPWLAPPRPPPWRKPRKGRDQILPSGNLAEQSSFASAHAFASGHGCWSQFGTLPKGYVTSRRNLAAEYASSTNSATRKGSKVDADSLFA